MAHREEDEEAVVPVVAEMHTGGADCPLLAPPCQFLHSHSLAAYTPQPIWIYSFLNKINIIDIYSFYR